MSSKSAGYKKKKDIYFFYIRRFSPIPEGGGE